MGKPNPRYSNGSRRRSLSARVRAMGMPCHLCGLPIDYSLPAGHPLSYELDEIVPVSRGGSPTDPANVAPAHRCCNQWRGNRSMARVSAVRDAARVAYGQWNSPQAFCEESRAVAASDKGMRASTPLRHPKRASGAV